MKKQLVLIISLIVLSLVGCNNTTAVDDKDKVLEELEISKQGKGEIENGITALKNKKENYIIENAVESADETIYSICVNTDKGSYTEYPVDADGNYGTLVFGSSDSMKYNIADWLNKDDNKYYVFTSDKESSPTIYQLSDAYGKFSQSRRYFYVDYMLPNFTYIKEADPIQYQDKQGNLHSLKCYECGLPADKVKDIIALQSYGQYKFTAEDENCDPNVKALLEYYLQQLDTPLTFADAKVFVGLDDDGVLSYVGIETGGGGNYFYYTQYLIEPDSGNNLRDVPDFSNAIPYESQFKDIAAFVATYPTTAEGVHALKASQEDIQKDGATILSDLNVPDGTENSVSENMENQD